MEMKQLRSHFQKATAQSSVLMKENKLLKNKLESQVQGIISPSKPSFVQVVKEAASVVPGHSSPQSKKAKTTSSPGPIDPRNNPVNNKVMAEKYKDLVIDDDAFFNSTTIRSNTGNLKFLNFRGLQRIPPSHYRKKFYDLGLPAHLIRDISFLGRDLMCLLTYDNLADEIAAKLLEFGQGRVHYLPDADPTDSSLYPEDLGSVSVFSINNAVRTFSKDDERTHNRNAVESRKLLFRSPRRRRYLILGTFWGVIQWMDEW